jgi:hypothetical protein
MVAISPLDTMEVVKTLGQADFGELLLLADCSQSDPLQCGQGKPAHHSKVARD